MPLLMYGYCRQKLGDPEEARRYYSRALEIDPTDPLAQELMGSLASTDADLLP
jgi:Tfp pilus assembly protein PilF